MKVKRSEEAGTCGEYSRQRKRNGDDEQPWLWEELETVCASEEQNVMDNTPKGRAGTPLGPHSGAVCTV